MANYNMKCTCKLYVNGIISEYPRQKLTICTLEPELKFLTMRVYSRHIRNISIQLAKSIKDALDKIDHMSNNPNVTSTLFDNLHNEIDDRDAMVAHLHTEVEAQKESLERAHRDAGRSIRMLNDRRLVIKGATDYSIPESHLTEMHHLANERFTEVEEMSSTIAALRLENQAASSSLQNMPAALFGTSNNAMPQSECEEKCARLKAEFEEMKHEKNEEVRGLRDELKEDGRPKGLLQE